MNALNLTLTKIATGRQSLAQVEAQLDELLNRVRWSPEYISLDTERTALRAQIKENEDLVRQLAIALYQETKVKKMPGVMVKEFSSWSVKYTPDKAVGWIEKKAKYLYTIDWQRFEAEALAARETIPFPCVEYVHTVECKAQIASNLDAFLQPETLAEEVLPF